MYRPFITWLNGSGLLILRLLGAPHQAHRHIHSPDEIELLIAESRDGGLLEPDEHRRLQRALRLNLRQATPADGSAEANLGARDRHAAQRGRSASSRRVPTRDCRSIAARSTTSSASCARRIWFAGSSRAGPATTLAELIRPIPSVHESVTADRVLKDLRERRSHQALVVDEFGGTAGLLTLADVLTELLGHVGDEFRSGQPAAETLADGRIRLAR